MLGQKCDNLNHMNFYVNSENHKTGYKHPSLSALDWFQENKVLGETIFLDFVFSFQNRLCC